MDLPLYINTAERDMRFARVVGPTDMSRVGLPIFAFGDRISVTIYLLNADGTYNSRSGDPALTAKLIVGRRGFPGLAVATSFATATTPGRWTCTLDLNTTEMAFALRLNTPLALAFSVTGTGPKPETLLSADFPLIGEIADPITAPSVLSLYYTAEEIDALFVRTPSGSTGLQVPALVAGRNLSNDGTNLTWSAAGSGTVTSVALALPNIFSVSGSPVTTAGTLTAALATQAANLVFAGPATGSAASPTFRAMVAADIPDLSGVYQPLDSDLTAIAALATTAFGRSTLIQANAAALATLAGVGTGDSPTHTALALAGTVGAGYLDITYQSATPATPAASHTRLFVDATGRPSWIKPDGFVRTFDGAANTASRVYTLPDATGDVAILATSGIAARTAAATWAARTITGTTNRLTVTNGDGVAGNPTLDISTSYVGQATITILGTIATGVWQGTAIANAYLANSAITIGTTSIALGASSTTLAGLTAVTVSDTFTLSPATLATGAYSYAGTLDASNSTTAGFKLASGLAVAKQGWFGDSLNASRSASGSTFDGLIVTNSSNTASSNAEIKIVNGGTSGGSPQVFFNLTTEGNWYIGAQANNNRLVLGSSVNSSGGHAMRISGANLDVNFPQTAQIVSLSGTTASTSTTTGAFQVVGGAGIGGALYIGGAVNLATGQGAAWPAWQIYQTGTSFAVRDLTNSVNLMTYVGGTGVTGQATLAGTLTVNGTGASSFAGGVSLASASPLLSVGDGSGSGAPEIKINRGTTAVSNAIKWYTASTQNWFLGSGATGTNTNWQLYTYSATLVAIDVAYTTGSITFNSAASGTSTTAAALMAKSLALTENAFIGGTLNLGIAGSAVGQSIFNNATSGSITLQPVTGALGSAVLSLPAATDTLVGRATTDTMSNKTLVAPALGTPASGVLTNCSGIAKSLVAGSVPYGAYILFGVF